VQTSGFKDGPWLVANGNPLGNTGTLIERIRRPNYGALEVEMTIERSDVLRGGVDDHAQTTAGSGQRGAGLLLPREREVLGAHGEDEEVNGSGIQRW
jgi:hypothetical protein